MMERVSQFQSYLTDVQSEIKKVVWPSRKDTTQTTIVVFGMTVVMSLFLWLVDTILASLVQLVIG
ncbi:preprotein translocase subunit SecE [Magnetofaba australis]|uniref:preprotein translocase subunit SecE n=1 Tax=Magnetofaba australis TaxID=1472297 RepID=UPI001F5327AA|nr:preprotein translocase subunit SecE [Magnetofaba australis]